mmetsp:Transcript_28032/g.96938  ORF Transcript_28032/g.96938 Transcript_28032/m.96938 type:complete len:333 (-) Transcript_28032:323-1321(-)
MSAACARRSSSVIASSTSSGAPSKKPSSIASISRPLGPALARASSSLRCSSSICACSAAVRACSSASTSDVTHSSARASAAAISASSSSTLPSPPPPEPSIPSRFAVICRRNSCSVDCSEGGASHWLVSVSAQYQYDISVAGSTSCTHPDGATYSPSPPSYSAAPSTLRRRSAAGRAFSSALRFNTIVTAFCVASCALNLASTADSCSSRSRRRCASFFSMATALRRATRICFCTIFSCALRRCRSRSKSCAPRWPSLSSTNLSHTCFTTRSSSLMPLSFFFSAADSAACSVICAAASTNSRMSSPPASFSSFDSRSISACSSLCRFCSART